jgi:hypothetical protein
VLFVATLLPHFARAPIGALPHPFALRFLCLFAAILPVLPAAQPAVSSANPLTLREDPAAHTLSVFRTGETKPLLVQNAAPGTRPFLHPIAAPDGRGVLTELSPSHHPHQTGLYWGLTRLNGRDFFHNRGADYWRRVAARAVTATGDEVKWAVTYELLGADGAPLARETQTWSLRDSAARYHLELTWTIEALADLNRGE